MSICSIVSKVTPHSSAEDLREKHYALSVEATLGRIEVLSSIDLVEVPVYGGFEERVYRGGGADSNFVV